MKPLLIFFAVLLLPPALGFALAPLLAKLDRHHRARRDAADRAFFDRKHPQTKEPTR